MSERSSVREKTAPPKNPPKRAVGPTSLQREQRDGTRKALLEAAHRAFTEHSYGATSVDDIVGRAGVSRTSFYRHFESKLAIAQTLFEEFMPDAYALWRELGADGDPSERQLMQWLSRFLKLIVANRTLVATMREVETLEAASYSAVMTTHDGIIRMLGERIPAFGRAALQTSEGESARIAAHLLLLQLDQFFYVVGVRDWQIDRDTGIRVMARQIRCFIDEVGNRRSSLAR